MICVNLNDPQFKFLAQHHGVSIGKLELITHKYRQMTGIEDAFPSDIFIANELGKTPYVEELKEVRDYYNNNQERFKDREFSTSEEAYATAEEIAKQGIPGKALVVYPNSKNGYTLAVRKPVEKNNISTKDIIGRIASEAQEIADFLLIQASIGEKLMTLTEAQKIMNPELIKQLEEDLAPLGNKVHTLKGLTEYLKTNPDALKRVQQYVDAGSQLTVAKGVIVPKGEDFYLLSSAIMTQANTFNNLASTLDDNIGNVVKKVILFDKRAYLWSTENGYEFFIEQSLAINEKNYDTINQLLDTYGTDSFTASAIDSIQRSKDKKTRSRSYLNIAKQSRDRADSRQAGFNSRQKTQTGNRAGDNGNSVASTQEQETEQFFIGRKARTQFEQSLRKARPDMTDAEIQSTLNFLHSLEDNKENTAYIKTAIRWIANKSITLPQDNVKARQAFDLARKKHIDLQKYNSLGELVMSPEMKPKEKEKVPFNPDKAKTFSNKRTVTTEGGRVFTVYDVENTEEGQREVCKALAAHYEMSPWCLSTFTASGEPTESAKKYWNQYNELPRKIAFENGKPVAFNSGNHVAKFTFRGMPVANNSRRFWFKSIEDPFYATNEEVNASQLQTNELLNQYKKDGLVKYDGTGNEYVWQNYSLTEKAIKELKEIEKDAWWDMEDAYAQDSLSDSIVSEYKSPEQQEQAIAAARNQAFQEEYEEYLRTGFPEPVSPNQEYTFNLPFFKTPNGEIYGFVAPNGDIYLDDSIMSPEHPIHEYTHVWDRMIAAQNPELWKRGIELMKDPNLKLEKDGKSLWQEVEEDINYGGQWQHLKETNPSKYESLIASEVHAKLTGKQGLKLLDEIAKNKGARGIVAKLKEWMLETWKELKATFSNWSEEDIQKLTLKDFVQMTLRDFADGINLSNNSLNNIENGTDRAAEENQQFPSFLGNAGKEKEANRVMAETAIYARGVGRGTELTEGFPKKQFLGRLKTIAQQRGEWIEDLSTITSRKYHKRGEENEIYLSKDGNSYIKLNNFNTLKEDYSIEAFVDRINSHNEFEPNAQYSILGFAENSKGEPCIILQQPIIKGEEASQKEINTFLKNSGFTKRTISNGGEGWTNGVYEIWDANEKNVLKDKQGQLYFIDVVINNIERVSAYKTQHSEESESNLFSDAQYNIANGINPEHPTLTVKEQEDINQQLDDYDRINQQIDTLNDNNILTSTEVRHISELAFNALSDLVTEIQQVEGKAQELFPLLNTNLDFQTADRKTIIETIGVGRLLDKVRELYFDTTNSEEDDIATLQEMHEVYRNWDGVVSFGTDIFAMNEGFGIKRNRKDSMYETTNGMHLGYESFNEHEDPDSIRELVGDEQEHWQVEQRTLDVLTSATELVRRALHDCYLKDTSGNYITKYGIKERVNSRTAVQSILTWTIGSQSLEEMISKLKDKEGTHTWLTQLLDRLSDESGNESDLQAQFFNTMCRSYQSYSIVLNEDGKYSAIPVNDHPAASDIMEAISGQFQARVHPLFQGENNTISKELLGRADKVSDKDDFSLHKGLHELQQIQAAHNNDRNNEPLTAEETNKIKDIISGVSKILGFEPANEVLDQVLTDKNTVIGFGKYETSDNRKTMLQSLKFIVNSLDKAYAKQRSGSKEAYQPFTYMAENNIRTDAANFLKPITDVMEETVANVVYDDGKLYQGYVIPSYLTLLLEKFHWDEDRFNEFIDKEYRKSEWFFDKNGEARTPWLETLTDPNGQRFEFKHKVELNFNKHAYMKRMTPEEYSISLLTHFWSEFNWNDTKNKPLVWYKIPIMSNKPSSEFVRFYAEMGDNFKENITKGLYKVFLQELSRIQTVGMRNLSEENPDAISNWDTVGRKFSFLPFLNSYLEDANTVEDYLESSSDNKKLATLIQKSVKRESLTPQEEADLNKLVQEAIKNATDRRTEDILNSWENAGILEEAQNVKNIMPSDVEKLKGEEGEKAKAQYVRNQVEKFLWNDHFAAINILQLTVGDIAAYGNAEELQKRLAELHAPGVRPYTKARDYKGNPVSDSKYRTIIIQDLEDFKSNIIENISEICNRRIEAAPEHQKPALRAWKEALVGKKGVYNTINVTDGQAYSSPSSYRKKAYIFGRWSHKAEDVYNKLRNEEFNIDELETAFQPLKPFVYGQLMKDVGVRGEVNSPIQNMPIPFQAKNSEYLLIMADAIIRGAEKDGIKTSKPSLLRAIYDVMEESETLNPTKGIDTVQFASAIKSGLQGAINLHQYINDEFGEVKAVSDLRNMMYLRDEEGNLTSDYNTRTFVHELDYSTYCLQQEVPDHFKNHSQAQGSQERMIIPSDLDFTDTFGNPNLYSWTDPNGTERKESPDVVRQEYENTIADNIYASIDVVRTQLGLPIIDRNGKIIHDGLTKRERNIALSKILQEEILDSPRYGIELFQACQVDKATGNFRIPLGDPVQVKRIEQLMNSIIKNRVNKQEVEGGPIVQVTNFGTSEQLHIRFNARSGGLLKSESEFTPSAKYQTYDEYKKAEQAGIAYFEVFAPSWNDDLLYNQFTDSKGNIDVDAIERVAPDLLRLISYRIPTEDKYSIAHMKIVGFLPKEAGSAIMFPYELTGIDDSDFDVDKRYVMRKHVEVKPDVKRSDLQYALETKLANEWEKAHEGKKVNKKWVKEQVRMFLDNPQKMRDADALMASLWKEYLDMAFSVESPEEGKYANDNKVFEITWGILSNEMTADKILNPGGFDELKRMSYIVTALKLGKASWNEMQSMSNKKLKDLSTEAKDLTWADTQLQFYKQNAAAASLIGVFAVHKIAHATLQGNGILMDIDEICELDSPFSIAGFEFSGRMEIDPKEDVNGNLIGKTIGSGVGASADAAKEPCLDQLNVNMTTVNILNTMLRLGVPLKTATMFLSQDVISRLLTDFNRQNLSDYVSFDGVLREWIDNVESKAEEAREVHYVDTSDLDYNNISEEELIKGIQPNHNVAIDLKVLLALQKLRKLAESMRKPTFATRFNSVSSATGPLVIDNLITKHKVDSFSRFNDEDTTGFYDAEGNVVDIHTIFNMHPVLKAFYAAYTIADEIFHDIPAGSFGFQSTLRSITEINEGEIPDVTRHLDTLAGHGILERIMNDKKLFDKYLNFYTSAMLINNGLINPKQLKEFIEKFPTEFMDTYKKKYKDNILVRDIKPIGSKRTGRTFLSIPITGKEEQDKAEYRAAWTDLHKEDPELSIKLATYWFFRGGIGFSPKTGTALIPNYVKEHWSVTKEDGSTITYNDVYRALESIVPSVLIDQFVRNNWNESKLVPLKKGDKNSYHYEFNKKDNTGKLIVTGKKAMNDLEGLRWIKTTWNYQTNLWHLTQMGKDFLVFEKVNPLGDNNEYVVIDNEMLKDDPIHNATQTVSNQDAAELASKTAAESEAEDKATIPTNTAKQEREVTQMAEMVSDYYLSQGYKNYTPERGQWAVDEYKSGKNTSIWGPVMQKALELKGIKVSEENLKEEVEKYC